METCSDARRHRVVAYFDVDCFYAQAEVLKRPYLQGRPVGVTQKFLVVTCNYEARQRGVPKMASIQTAKERCPDLVLFNGEDLTPYRAASKNIMAVLGRFGVLERRGLDEAALDITEEVMKRMVMPKHQGFQGHVVGLTHFNEIGYNLHLDSNSSDYYLMVGSQLVSEIRAAIEGETGFRCSSGIATNKMLAKLVSSANKPNQQTCILESAVNGFLTPLCVRKLPGIGHQTESLLKDMGITTVADLQLSTFQQLSTKFGNRLGTILFDSCRGVDESAVQDKGPLKSLSVEDSFQPCTSFKQAEGIIRGLAPDLIARLDEDRDEYCRRPKIFTIKWRYPGNWAFRSSSATMPLELISTIVSMEKRLETVVEVAMKLLSQSLGRQSFSIVVLNIGATSFTASSNGSFGASHDIRSFLSSPSQTSQKTLRKVVSKREARFNREETEKGGLNIESAQSVLKNSDKNDAWQGNYLPIHNYDTQLSDEDVCELDLNEDRWPWMLDGFCSSRDQRFRKLRELLPSTTDHAASSSIGLNKGLSMEASDAVLHGTSDVGDITTDVLEAGSLVEGSDGNMTAVANCQVDFCTTLEQTFATLATFEPTRSKQMSMKNVLHHQSPNKRARTQNERKRSQSGTLDCFFAQSQR
ncbi:hypothetical protein GOP47_0020896 [Adiantum capillus-veneris]|uniref:UmuC domain-containing protein n=1 Tax=Adiantum capillus-veneris TaxID=13818 RepID=A0A9D4Z951_ADICA|nr:hypothetical protein GOP47_0020896 [Adiantum capillus-veneris]